MYNPIPDHPIFLALRALDRFLTFLLKLHWRSPFRAGARLAGAPRTAFVLAVACLLAAVLTEIPEMAVPQARTSLLIVVDDGYPGLVGRLQIEGCSGWTVAANAKLSANPWAVRLAVQAGA